MILFDANVLLYAYHRGAQQHAVARRFVEAALAGPELVCFCWITLHAFLRIVTNPRVFEHPLSADEAVAAVASWLDQPVSRVIDPGENHWKILSGLLVDEQVVGPLVSDAALAAIAIEHGATLCTTDRDFARFRGLRTLNPLGEDAPSS